jgi:hypothetical protein
MNDARQQAERSADRIRAELFATLRELNRRRHRAFDLKYQLGKHFVLLAAIAGGGLLVAGVAVTVGLVRARLRRESRFAERVRGLMRAWENPENIARRASAPILSADTLRKVAATAALTLANELAQRGVKRLLWSGAHP